MQMKVNLGTFPVETAKEIGKVMRKTKKNGRLHDAVPAVVTIRGRGSRKGGKGSQHSISLKNSTSAAVYIDVEVNDARILREVLIARDETMKKEAVLQIERTSAGLDERELKIVQENMVSRILADRSEVEEMVKFGYVGVMNLNGRELLGMLIDKLEIENLNRKRV